MEIKLAGLNVDKDQLDETKAIASRIENNIEVLRENLKKIKKPKELSKALKIIEDDAKKIRQTEFTPESICAAYGRISRRLEDIPALRAEAAKEIAEARKTNTNIIHQYGHSSIAEHGIFNFDIMGVTRLFVNFLEKARLCSYTEKSMRYVLFSDDFLAPKEIEINYPEFRKLFEDSAKRKFGIYKQAVQKGFERAVKINPDLAADMDKNKGRLEGFAKEDARYILPLATLTQLGMTVSARNLEHILAEAASEDLIEVQEFGKRMQAVIEGIAPSLIKYTGEIKNLTESRNILSAIVKSYQANDLNEEPSQGAGVRIVHSDPDADNKIIATLLLSAKDSEKSYGYWFNKAKNMSLGEKLEVVKGSFSGIKKTDQVLRDYEFGDIIAEIIMSEACYAQWKRHRMMSPKRQGYTAGLSFTLPQAIYDTKMNKVYEQEIEQTVAEFERVKGKLDNSDVAAYLLPLAMNMRTVTKVNARELYHLSRLREDMAAQWDVRQHARELIKLAKQAMPVSMVLAAGRHQFEEVYKEVMKDM